MTDTWKMVPLEPTEEMLDAYWKLTGESKEMRARTHAYMRRYYKAMLAAVPEQNASDNPMTFFSENVDTWGAAEWFDRLAKAIRAQDDSVVKGDEISTETYKMIASSSAMRLVRDFEHTVRIALSALAAALEQPAARVKQLDWDGYEARSPNGNLYRIHKLSDLVHQLKWNGTALHGWYSSIEKAMDAAEDHCLSVDPLFSKPSDEITTLRYRLEQAEKELERFRSERSYVVGFNDGYNEGCGS